MGWESPAHTLKPRPTLHGQSDFAVAITAIHRSPACGFERYLSVFAAFGTLHREHLAYGPVAVAIVPVVVAGVTGLLRLPCLTACGTALGIVSIASLGELFLFINAECERSLAIVTLNRFVLKTHWMTSFLKILVKAGHPILDMNPGENKKLV